MSTPAQALTAAARGGIIKPGPGLIRAAQPLASPKRALGKYPYQWEDPGPNSSMALPSGAVAIPQATVLAPLPISTIIFSYEVPEGFRFSLTGVTLDAFATDWNQGSGQLTFSLQVKYSTGPRTVEFLSAVPFGLGSRVRPYPLKGRLEFAPLDVIQAIVTNVNLPTPGANDYAYGILQGFTYPTSESI